MKTGHENPRSLSANAGIFARSHLVAFGLLGCLASQTAQAETGAENWSLWGDSTEITVGAGAAVLPRYAGSSEYKVIPVPVVALQRGAFFADIIRGVGAEYYNQNGFYVSAAVGYDMGRTTRDSTWEPGSTKLIGMNLVKETVTANLVVSQALTPWLSATAEAEFAMSGQRHRGNQYRVGLLSYLRDDDRDTVSVALNAHGGDRDYLKTYFGVTDAESRTSRFAQFDAGSGGVYAGSLTGTWSHSFNKHYSVDMAVSVMQLVGDPGRSPLVSEKTSVTTAASLNYTF